MSVCGNVYGWWLACAGQWVMRWWDCGGGWRRPVAAAPGSPLLARVKREGPRAARTPRRRDIDERIASFRCVAWRGVACVA